MLGQRSKVKVSMSICVRQCFRTWSFFAAVFLFVYIYNVTLLLRMHTSYCFTQAQKEMTVLQDGVKLVIVTPYISNQYRYEAFNVKSNILFILCVVLLKLQC